MAANTGRYITTPRTLTDGDQQDTRVDSKGALVVSLEDGSGGSGGRVTGVNTQARQAETTALPAFYILAKDVNNNDALIGVMTLPSPLTAGTNRSGTATTTSATLAAANPNRRGLEIQNIGANNIGINEFGGTAGIGTAGTYTLAPGASMRVRTNQLVTVIAATASTAFTATEWW